MFYSFLSRISPFYLSSIKEASPYMASPLKLLSIASQSWTDALSDTTLKGICIIGWK